MSSIPTLVAHRGERAHFPENTVPALLGAVRAGAAAVEFDIRFTADGEPVLCHDADLSRICGERVFLRDISLERLRRYHACEPERFGDRFSDVPVPTLADAVAALAEERPVTLFAEIKTDAVAHSARPTAVESILSACGPVLDRTVIIGFDEGLLRLARSLGAPEIGWVASALSRQVADRAEALAPEYLFVDRKVVPQGRLWPGNWRWVVYEVNDALEAERLAKAGAWGVETASVADLAAALSER
ncbi:MAG: glycerophosphodiester phosphodiesterase family protein [Ectothiorhodospiraceae bacterium]|jgi:glycerophosphoryl diester phosphodiesterase